MTRTTPQIKRALLALCTVALLAGCAGPRAIEKAPRAEASAEANVRAIRLYAQGEFAAALAQARRAYDAAASVEDEDGIVASLLNVSMIEQRLGNDQAARQAVDRILTSNGLQFSLKSTADAALRRAVLATSDGDAALSEKLLVQAEQVCPTPCALGGKVANLRAQLAIEGDRLQAAVDFAEKGRTASIALKDAEEEANALRLGANALIHLGQADGAMQRLDAALKLDKRLGLSRKIYRDLFLLGIAAKLNKQDELARKYLQRAREVAQADRYAAGVKEVDALLSGQ